MINALFQNNAFVAFSVPCSGVLLILYLEIFRNVLCLCCVYTDFKFKILSPVLTLCILHLTKKTFTSLPCPCFFIQSLLLLFEPSSISLLILLRISAAGRSRLGSVAGWLVFQLLFTLHYLMLFFLAGCVGRPVLTTPGPWNRAPDAGGNA